MESDVLVRFAEQPLDSEADCRQVIADARRVRGFADAREAAAAARLLELQVFAEEVIATTNKTGLGSGARIVDRAKVCDTIPELGDLLADGGTTGAHVDVVAGAVRGLSASDRDRVAEHGERLAREAARTSKREFERLVKGLVESITPDDSSDRLARQKKATRLSFRPGVDGMWLLRGEFDPENAALLHAKLSAERERIVHGPVPDTAPVDPIARQDHFYALALLNVVEGRGGSAGTGDLTVLIDATTLVDGRHDGSIVDVSPGGFDLPVDVIRRWACSMDVTPVVVHPNGTSLWVGRTQRLATAAQRRVLRVWHPTCICCDTPFERTTIHHVDWWTHGGRTDIDRLVPLCDRMHHLVHDHRWTIHIHPDRSITITRPDGTHIQRPPPDTRAA